MTKICTKCNTEKPTNGFYKQVGQRFDVTPVCKMCTSIQHKLYYIKNKDKVKATSKGYRNANKDRCSARTKKWRKANPERAATCSSAWIKANPKKAKEFRRIREKRKLKTDPKFKLNKNMRRYIGLSLKGNKNGRKWEDLVGYALNDLIKHLEKQFLDGMSWKNHGEWHIDHEIPISAFNFTKPEHEDFKRCWALKNLQPMWAVENIIKSNKLTKPFQPSLLL